MLFVIVIISLLAATMFPLFTVSRSKAFKTKCVSNMNQLSIAVKLYSDEYRSYPDAYRAADGGVYYWCGFMKNSSFDFKRSPMHDYIRNPGILVCPYPTEKYKSLDPSVPSTCSYGMNVEYVGGSPEPNNNPTEQDILNSPPANLLDIAKPDTTLAFMDSAFMNGGELTESYYFWPRYGYATGGLEHEARGHFRHNRVAVGAFCDGHVADNLLPDAIQDSDNRLGWPNINQCKRR